MHCQAMSESTGLADEPAQVINLLGKSTIGGELAVHPARGQDGGVMAVKPEPDLLQARAAHHLKSQQHRNMPA